MCVTQVTMVPAVVNAITTKGKDTYTGFISEFACFKCKNLSGSERESDVSELWTSKRSTSKPLLVRAQSPRSAFRWRKFAGSGAPPGSGGGGGGATGKEVQTPAIQSKADSKAQINKEKCCEEDMMFLKFLALNALDLSAPASDVLLKTRNSSWFQLSGHPDSLAPAGPGTVWKKRSGSPDDTERTVYEELSQQPELAGIVPKYYREVDYQGEKFIELQDLLHGFQDPYVIDIKMGTRTFLESEVRKSTPRPDLYQKMVAIDPEAPTVEERALRAVTKLRYMQFREQQSSTCSQGFRIEAMKCRGSPPVTDLKKVKTREEVAATMERFLKGRPSAAQALLRRLCEIRRRIERSEYFKTREIIGSSVFMIYDDAKIGVWLIDFAKTNKLPDGLKVDHRSRWVQGNHEEGLLYGLDQLISVLEELQVKKKERLSLSRVIMAVSAKS